MKSDRKGVYIDSLENAMTDSVKRIDSTLHVNIDAFYEGNKYYATTYQDLYRPATVVFHRAQVDG